MQSRTFSCSSFPTFFLTKTWGKFPTLGGYGKNFLLCKVDEKIVNQKNEFRQDIGKKYQNLSLTFSDKLAQKTAGYI